MVALLPFPDPPASRLVPVQTLLPAEVPCVCLRLSALWALEGHPAERAQWAHGGGEGLE